MFKKLTKQEKKTFKLHTAHSFLEGIIDGSLLLNEFILIKSLLGSNYQISYLFQFSVIPLFLSVLLNEFIKRTANKKKLLRIVAIVTRLPLIFVLFFPDSLSQISKSSVYASIYLLIFLFYYMYKPVILPTINLLLRANYSSQNFGKLYSYSTSLKKITVLASTFLFGLVLDYNHYAFIYIMPVFSLLGILSIFLLTFVDFSNISTQAKTRNLFSSIRHSVSDMISIIKTNKPYRDFELGFIIYGLSWMGTTAVITIFMEKQLHLSYSAIAFYKNTYNIIAIVLLPFVGKLISRIDPRKFAIITFTTLLLHLIFIPITQYLPLNFTFFGIQFYVMLFVSFVFNGIFTALMALLWGIGSSYFCNKQDAGTYQSIHLTSVGMRGMFAPIIGVLFFEHFGYNLTFVFGVLLLLIAIVLMAISQKKYRLT